MKNLTRMDKAIKTIEWVKLIDYDYSQNMVKVRLRLIQRSVMKWSLKNQGLKVQVSNLKRHENVCTIVQSFWINNVKREFWNKKGVDEGV